MKFFLYAVLIVAPLAAYTPLVHAQDAPEAELTVAQWVEIYRTTPGCKQNPADTAELAANLKGQYAIVSCYDPIKGWAQIILAPKSAEFPRMQIIYGNSPLQQLNRARFVDHFVVLEFEKQVQYLDLLKPHPVSAFTRVGFVDNANNPPFVMDFENALIFVDALKNYAGLDERSQLALQLPGIVTKAVGDKPYKLQYLETHGERTVFAWFEGRAHVVWPEPKP